MIAIVDLLWGTNFDGSPRFPEPVPFPYQFIGGTELAWWPNNSR